MCIFWSWFTAAKIFNRYKLRKERSHEVAMGRREIFLKKFGPVSDNL